MSSTEEVDSGDVDNAAKLIREAVELRANAVNQKASDDFRRLAEASENGIISLSLNEIDQLTTKWYDNISTRPVTLLAEYRQEDVQAYRRQLKVTEEGCKNLNDGPTARDLNHTLKKLLKSIDLSSANTASGKQAIQELIHTRNVADERLAAAIAHRTIRQTIPDEQAVFDKRVREPSGKHLKSELQKASLDCSRTASIIAGLYSWATNKQVSKLQNTLEKVHSLPNAEISSTIARSRRRYGDLRFNDENSAFFKSRAESLQHDYTSLRSEQLPKVKEGHRRRYQITSNDADGQKDILRQMEDLVSSHEYQIDLGQAPPCLRDIAILKDEHEELQWTHSQWRSKEVERFRTLLSVSGNLDARNKPSDQFDCIIELLKATGHKGEDGELTWLVSKRKDVENTVLSNKAQSIIDSAQRSTIKTIQKERSRLIKSLNRYDTFKVPSVRSGAMTFLDKATWDLLKLGKLADLDTGHLIHHKGKTARTASGSDLVRDTVITGEDDLSSATKRFQDSYAEYEQNSYGDKVTWADFEAIIPELVSAAGPLQAEDRERPASVIEDLSGDEESSSAGDGENTNAGDTHPQPGPTWAQVARYADGK